MVLVLLSSAGAAAFILPAPTMTPLSVEASQPSSCPPQWLPVFLTVVESPMPPPTPPPPEVLSPSPSPPPLAIQQINVMQLFTIDGQGAASVAEALGEQAGTIEELITEFVANHTSGNFSIALGGAANATNTARRALQSTGTTCVLGAALFVALEFDPTADPGMLEALTAAWASLMSLIGSNLSPCGEAEFEYAQASPPPPPESLSPPPPPSPPSPSPSPSPPCGDTHPGFCAAELTSSSEMFAKCKQAMFFERCQGTCYFCPAPPPPPPPSPPPPSPPSPPPPPSPPCGDADPTFCEAELTTYAERTVKCKELTFYERCQGTCLYCPQPPPSPPPPVPSLPPSPPPPSLEFVIELGSFFGRRLQSGGRRLQSGPTVGDLVDALTATLPGVKAKKLLLLQGGGQSPTLWPPLFDGLDPDSHLPAALGAPLPPPPVNVTVRVYLAVCADGWVSRLSPRERAAWATDFTAALGAESSLAVPPPCFDPTCPENETKFECDQKCHRHLYACNAECAKKKRKKKKQECKQKCEDAFSYCKNNCIACHEP